MGWTEHIATHFYENGQINRKAECDAYFEKGLNRGHYKIVKSVLKGSVYYAAVATLRRTAKDAAGRVLKDEYGDPIYEDIPENEQVVHGVVILTYVRNRIYFGYKGISETMGPSECRCPKSVLNKLSETTDADALDWRERCRKNLASPSLSQLPIGTEISFMRNGNTVVLRKAAPAYQFKTPFWINDATFQYVKKKNLPEKYDVIYLP